MALVPGENRQLASNGYQGESGPAASLDALVEGVERAWDPDGGMGGFILEAPFLERMATPILVRASTAHRPQTKLQPVCSAAPRTTQFHRSGLKVIGSTLTSITLRRPLGAAGGTNAGDDRSSLAVGGSGLALLRGHGVGGQGAAPRSVGAQRAAGRGGRLGALEFAQGRRVAHLSVGFEA